jgi:hypothetical protein
LLPRSLTAAQSSVNPKCEFLQPPLHVQDPELRG